MKRSYFKRKISKPMNRTKLKIVGDSDTATKKKEIQSLVRLNVCHRDGGCVLRELRWCGGEAVVENGKIFSNRTIQADHLITRANSATFADTRLIVCLCSGCHMWKKYHQKEYDELVKKILPRDRIELWDKMEEYRKAHKTYKMDWSAEILNLKRELKTYE